MRPDSERERASTPELDAFLGGDLPRPLSADESLERLRELFRPACESLGDATLRPRLVVALWRVARLVGTACGRVSEDEMLEDALADLEPCPWTARLRAVLSPSQRCLVRAGAAAPLLDLAASPAGLSLLPPRDGADRAVVWCEALELAADALRLARAPRGPETLRLLRDPVLAPRVSVTPVQVLELEELLVAQARDVLVRDGERAVVAWATDELGTTRSEGLGLIRLARAAAIRLGRSSVEEDRAVMTATLKDFVDRARAGMSLAEELRALRELARVQGLTRTEPEDRGAEFLSIVRRTGAAQDARLPALQPPPEDLELLEDGSPEEVEEVLERLADQTRAG